MGRARLNNSVFRRNFFFSFARNANTTHFGGLNGMAYDNYILNFCRVVQIMVVILFFFFVAINFCATTLLYFVMHEKSFLSLLKIYWLIKVKSELKSNRTSPFDNTILCTEKFLVEFTNWKIRRHSKWFSRWIFFRLCSQLNWRHSYIATTMR